MGKSASAIGKSKQEARSLAAERVLEQLVSKERPKPQKAKNTIANTTKRKPGGKGKAVAKSNKSAKLRKNV